MQINLVMLGPPGAGKGTQAYHLKRLWNIPHISTGSILRAAVREGTDLGRQAAAIMEAGGLVDDGLMTGIVRERLQQPDVTPGFLLDGFPRTIAQAEALDGMLGDGILGKRAPLIILELALSDDDVVKRLAARMVCHDCGVNRQDDGEFATCHDCGGPLVPRADDKEQVVRGRLEIYRQQTVPLLSYYESRPTFCRIDGAQLFDTVATSIVTAVTRCADRRNA
jgi:adenylate kinase